MIDDINHYTPMSTRSWSGNALVLSLSSFGEGHREALLLTEEKALVRAAVFGGAKSKLRSLVSPWQSGRIWIYTDPVKKSSKITDFDVTSWRQGIREDLIRTWCASVCSEIVTRSHGIADWRLVNAFLDGISVSDETECRYALLRFFWRVLLAAGIAPDVSACVRCGEPVNEVLYYSPLEEACICERCVKSDESRFPLSREACIWLEAIEHLSPSQARSARPESRSYAELRQFLFFLVSRMIDGQLKTLEAGEGIL